MNHGSPVTDRRGCTASLLPASGNLLDSYDGVILDLDGVVYIGPDPVPAAAEAITRLREADVPLCFLTNNASRTSAQVADHLRELGLDVTDDHVLTSAQVAAALLAADLPVGAPVLVIGGDGLRRALRREGLTPVTGLDSEPEAVVQGFNPELDWKALAEGTYAVRSGLPWIATNLDRTVPTPRGPAPGNGILVGVIEAATGRSPDRVAGKPRPEPFRQAAARMGSSTPLMVGDRLDTDIRGARNAGIDAMLVLTGVSTATQVLRCPPDRRPHYLGRDLADLHAPLSGTTCRQLPDPAGNPSRIYRGSCAEAVVEANREHLSVISAGRDALDLLRAACAAHWAGTGTADAGTDVDERVAGVVAAIHRLEPTAPWAR
jgi:HAD superfamily hydrolase (TIGR01450 family)